MSNKRKAAGDPQEGTVRWMDWRFSKPSYLSVEEFKVLWEPLLEWVTLETAGSKHGTAFQLEAVLQPDGTLANWHYSGALHVPKKERPKAVAVRKNKVFPGISIRPCSEAGVEALRKYSVKSKTRQAGPWGTTPEIVKASNYDYKDVYAYDQLRPFQKTVADCCKLPVNARTINWVYDPRGNSGKSELGKYLTRHCDAEYCGYGDAKSLTHYVSENMYKKAYVFDLSKCKPADFSGNDIYSVMEGIKNGRLVNLKYMSKKVEQPSAHVWVFANILPKREVLSDDRWMIHEVTTDFKLIPFDSKSHKDAEYARQVEAAAQKLMNAHRKKLIDKEAKDLFNIWKASLASRLVPIVPAAPDHVPVPEADIDWTFVL